jgi:hypothetical protein
MHGQSGHSRAMSANVGEIERRLRSVEQRLERVGGARPQVLCRRPTMSARQLLQR